MVAMHGSMPTETRMARTSALLALLTAIGLAAAPTPSEVPKLDWADLLPPEARVPAPIVDHTRIPTFDDLPHSAFVATVPELDGRMVKLPGFVVPLDMVGDKVTSFLLVPYFGACIHEPPPPPNQIVYVEFGDPVELSSMYHPVWVTGTLGTEAHTSELAYAGYTMLGEAVEKYQY